MITSPMIPQTTLIHNDTVLPAPNFGNLRIVRYQSDANARVAFDAQRYEFQHEYARRHVLPGVTLALKGSSGRYRITAMLHPTLRQFIDIVKYDPSHPPIDDYDALGMKEAHDQTQSDFRGAKKENLANFKQYVLEAIRSDRIAYLPPISGWQSKAVFDDTFFVAYDESNPLALYGVLYLPKKPIMQADGQTQTAALFQAAATGVAINSGVLDSFGVTLEIELNVDQHSAGQSFADRNGRGSKKNKNLVSLLDSSSPLARLRRLAVEGTVFEGRLADGRSDGTTVTATQNIVDLSTLDQMLLNVISKGTKKPEHIKHYHINHFLPYCREFLQLLDVQFAESWLVTTPAGGEPYRRLYVHGWAFCLKALALAYHDARRDELGPLGDAITSTQRDDHVSNEEAERSYILAVEEHRRTTELPPVSLEELTHRLSNIDWIRHRRHWIAITGAKIGTDGKKKTRKLRDGSFVVDAKSENTAASINSVVNKILSPNWTDLCGKEDEPIT